MQTDVSKSVFWVEAAEGDPGEPPDWLFDDPDVYRKYSVEIAAVKLSKIFGWTLEYSRKVASDPFQASVCYGVLDGLNKAQAERNKG